MLTFYILSMPDAAGLKKLTTDVLHKKILNLEFWGSFFFIFGHYSAPVKREEAGFDPLNIFFYLIIS